MQTTLSSTRIVDLVIEPQKIDWRRIADDMKQAGLSYYAQSNAVGKEWSTYQKLLNGSEPGHSFGMAVLNLHTICFDQSLTTIRLTESNGRLVVETQTIKRITTL